MIDGTEIRSSIVLYLDPEVLDERGASYNVDRSVRIEGSRYFVCIKCNDGVGLWVPLYGSAHSGRSEISRTEKTGHAGWVEPATFFDKRQVWDAPHRAVVAAAKAAGDLSRKSARNFVTKTAVDKLLKAIDGSYRVEVPEQLGDKDLVAFFERYRWEIEPNTKELLIDLKRSEFLAPWALTMFALYGLWLSEERGVDVRVQLDPGTRAGAYAVKAGLLELFDTIRPEELAELEDTRMAGLMRIKSSSDIPEFANSVMELLSLANNEVEGAVRYSLVELLRNVVQHSSSPAGGLAMAQYYPATGLVELVVADFGVGVLHALQPRYPDLSTHLAGLKFALLPHVSGTFGKAAYTTMSDNAGLGLFFIKEIATRAAGGFFLASGESLIDLWGKQDGSPGRKYIQARCGGWPGTLAVLQLRRDSISDFDSLLGVCRELSAKARGDPSELALDFIDEVPALPGLTVIKVVEFEEDVDKATEVRDTILVPCLERNEMVIMDFSGIRFATQSFAHACMYKVLRDFPEVQAALSIAGATGATQEAIRAVAAYARVPDSQT